MYKLNNVGETSTLRDALRDFAGLGDVITEFYELLTASQVVDGPTFDGGWEGRFVGLRREQVEINCFEGGGQVRCNEDAAVVRALFV